MKRFLLPKRIILIFFLLLFSQSSWINKSAKVLNYDLVICVDLSASTNGILNDIRNRMWIIINGIHRKYENVNLRIGVVGYGRPSFGSSDGYVRIISNLTSDFDFLSYQLYQLKPYIEKGDQFVPLALQAMLAGLSWSKNADAIKTVYLIGNGSAYTGSINLEDVCEEYRNNRITVSTIFVMKENYKGKNESGYKRIADITGGRFYNISAESGYEKMKLKDEEKFLISMSNSFNSTMMFFTKDAQERKKYAFETDKKMFDSGADNFAARLNYKSSGQYLSANATFDLVSYYILNGTFPEKINSEFLFKEEKIFKDSEILEMAHKKAIARIRLTDEIRYLFTKIRNDTIPHKGNRLDDFVLADSM